MYFNFNPQMDGFTTGSSYAYDGANKIYISAGVASGAVQYISYLNMLDNKIYGLGAIPNTQSAPVIGNRMEIITSPSSSIIICIF